VPDAPPPASPGNETPVTEIQLFDVDAREVERVDAWIEAVGQRWGQSQKTIFSARLCVAELFANVIEHGIATSDRARIAVTLTRRDDGIGVEFRDTCGRFDPTAVAPPAQGHSVETATVEGRGLILLRAYARELAYHHDGSGNHVRLWVEAR
jgi:anti-sigma regulatory factor (Ser/Thr protein kinase)